MSKTKKARAPAPRRRQANPKVDSPATPAGAPGANPGGKLGVLVGLLHRASGARMDEMTAATGWQPHTVRGAISGSLKKRLGFSISSTKDDAGRSYRITDEAAGG